MAMRKGRARIPSIKGKAVVQLQPRLEPLRQARALRVVADHDCGLGYWRDRPIGVGISRFAITAMAFVGRMRVSAFRLPKIKEGPGRLVAAGADGVRRAGDSPPSRSTRRRAARFGLGRPPAARLPTRR